MNIRCALSVFTALGIFTVYAPAVMAAEPKAPAATQQKMPAKNADTSAKGHPLDTASKEDILERVNGILSRNPQILEMVPDIKKETRGDAAVFKIGGKDMESMSKEELIGVLRKINPALLKIQQERLKKQNEQILRQHQQNMQIQAMAQQQSRMANQRVYTPPAKQPTPPTPYKPPAPPRR